jgi:phospholipid/cholesterol/gamma-HCH transport system permease protein
VEIWVSQLGDAVIKRWHALTAMLYFGLHLLRVTFNPRTYDSATRWIIVKQVYFTAVQALPIFLAYSLIISALLIQIMVSVARDLGLSDYVPSLIVSFLLTQLLPLLSALFIALRSGAAINTEIALMHVNNELAAFEHAQIDPMRYEFMPRVIGGVVSMLALTSLAIIGALIIAFLGIYGWQWANWPSYTHSMALLLPIPLVLGVIIKTSLFGLAVTLIPLKTGLEIPKRLFLVPVAVLKGMMRVFFAIFLIEVASLAFNYI